MTTTNFPTATVQNEPGPKNYKNAFIGLLAAAVIGLGSFLVYDKNKASQTIQQQETKITAVTSEKSEIQKSFDASLARLDSMTGVNTGLQSALTGKNKEIAKVKAQIRGILNKSNATASELAKARGLISELNGKITGLEQDVARLTRENESLNKEKITLTADKEKLNKDLSSVTTVKHDLEKKVEIASTLNASNIVITPIKVKNNGREKVSTTAKRVDKLVITFDVDNRIAQSGLTDVYVLVIGPDGTPASKGTDTFTTRNEGNKTYTAKLPVDLETAKKKNVEFSFAPGSSFQKGNYTVQIYQNGFKIGESTCELKKGGLFS